MRAAQILILCSFISANMVIAVWDLYVTAIGEPQNTVSTIVAEWSAKYPLFPFFLGVVVGHVLFPVQVPCPPKIN